MIGSDIQKYIPYIPKIYSVYSVQKKVYGQYYLNHHRRQGRYYAINVQAPRGIRPNLIGTLPVHPLRGD